LFKSKNEICNIAQRVTLLLIIFIRLATQNDNF